MCKLRVEGRISSSDEKEFETQSFPDIHDLSITTDGRLARVVNGVIGYYLDITGPVLASASGSNYRMDFSNGSLTSCKKI